MSKAKKKTEEKVEVLKPPSPKSNNLSLKFFKTHEDTQLPVFSTDQSACFDVYARLKEGEEIAYYQAISTKQLPRRVSFDINSGRGFVPLNNNERMLIPTGLIADIPEGFSIRLHSRSGLAFKQGVYLANCEGVIDSDYIDPIFAMVTSMSNVPVKIYDGDRICQGELIRCENYTLDESDEAPSQKTNRDGGFGSTGT
jgi:dUTP pyrophosphatase